MLLDALVSLLPMLLPGNLDPAPEPEDVKAGWTAFGLFLGGVAAVALLGWSLTKQLRKADDARKRGVYGDEPETDAAGDGGPTASTEGSNQV